jgi:hypothetical protein
MLRVNTDPAARADERALLPVLCGPSSPRGATMLELSLVRQPLVSDRVFVLLALAETTPHGRIGMEWLDGGAVSRGR